jgi:hypothetical protein
LEDSGGFHYGRLSLPVRKLGGFFPVRVYARKPLPILVEYRHLPVAMFSASVLAKLGAFSCSFFLGHGVNISVEFSARKYQFNQYFRDNTITLH